MRGIKHSFRMVAAAIALMCSLSALSASVNNDDLTALTADAKAKGATPVVVHLDAVSLAEMAADIAGVKARMSAKANLLLAELGTAAWTAGRWDNGIGQLGLNVTEAGLKLLQNSGNAIHFYPGRPWYERTALSGLDGRFAEIERELSSRGVADVQVVLNVEGMEFDLGKDGSLMFSGSDRSTASAVRSARSLFAQLNNAEAFGKDVAASRFEAMDGLSTTILNPVFTLRVNREGLEKLVNSKDVRSIKPVGFIDKRKTSFDDDAIKIAEKNGTAEVIITVRNPLEGGHLSKASFDSNRRSNKKTMDSVLAGAGVRSAVKDIAVFGAASGHLTASELRALRASGDRRLLGVELNKPVATAQLMTSTDIANFPSAWAAGFRGAGQNLIVMDTGIQSNHRFFQGANGLSKVGFEACFGTNVQTQEANGTITWESNCPSQVGTTGDSPLGMVGSAAPRLNCRANSTVQNAENSCHHGTHVAGIAAGRNSATFESGFQGVANEANIVAVQVFSFDAALVAEPQVFYVDLLGALEAAVLAMTPGTYSNPFTVNMSLGGPPDFSTSCPTAYGTTTAAITTAVQALFNMGVPVVAATGNKGSRSTISFPACVPRVVKVGSVENLPATPGISYFTNLANPANFPGDFFWMAPGGGFFSSIKSAINGTATVNGWTQSTGNMLGTSMASPHVAGLYALVKAAVSDISVDEVSNWIQANASLPQTPICIGPSPCVHSPSTSVVFRRIRVPNF